MPTDLPTAPQRHDDRRLTLSQTAVFLTLIARIRILDMRLSAVYRRAERRGREPHGPTLLRLVRRWLTIHERIGALLPGIPEPQHVQEVRSVLRMTEKANAQHRSNLLALLPGIPEPQHVQEVRSVLRMTEKANAGFGEADQPPVPSRHLHR